MKVLLDECLPRKLTRPFAQHLAKTVSDMDWAGKSNGELLELAAEHFDVLVTADQKLSYQQNLTGHKIAVVVLCASSTRLKDLLQLMPAVLAELEHITPESVTRVGLRRSR